MADIQRLLLLIAAILIGVAILVFVGLFALWLAGLFGGGTPGM